MDVVRRLNDERRYQEASESMHKVDLRDSFWLREAARAYIGLRVKNGWWESNSTYLKSAGELLAGHERSSNPELLQTLGELYILQEKCQEAADLFQNMIFEFPRYKQLQVIYLRGSEVSKKVGSTEESITYLQKVLDDIPLDFEETEILLLLALAYEAQGDKRMTKEAYKQSYKKMKEQVSSDTGFDPSNRDKVKLISIQEWRARSETWRNVARKCHNSGLYLYALDLFTKALWTEEGKNDADLWIEFADCCHLLSLKNESIQACATAYSMDPMNLSLRYRLRQWDPEIWGVHTDYEEWVVTKLQSIHRGTIGRRVAAAHKRDVLVLRALRYRAATQIQTVARCLLARVLISRLREEKIQAEISYRRFLYETRNCMMIQCFLRCIAAKVHVRILRREFQASRKIQCSFRCFLARRSLKIVRLELQHRKQNRGAIEFQRILRGYVATGKVATMREQKWGAIHIQRQARYIYNEGCPNRCTRFIISIPVAARMICISRELFCCRSNCNGSEDRTCLISS